MIKTIVFDNGDRIHTSCRVEEDKELVSLFIGKYRGPTFGKEKIVEIRETKETELNALDYPIYMFLYQQYDENGKLTFVFPSSPLNEPIAAEDIKE